MKTINFKIDCGKETCASEPGKFCQFVRLARFGTIYFCQIWHEYSNKYPLPLETVDGTDEGWLKRRPECLAAQVDEELHKQLV